MRSYASHTSQLAIPLPPPKSIPSSSKPLVAVPSDGNVDDGFRHLDVRLRRGWIAGGVILDQDYRKMPESPNCIDPDDLSRKRKIGETFNGSLDSL
jgi:hypothetical protein